MYRQVSACCNCMNTSGSNCMAASLLRFAFCLIRQMILRDPIELAKMLGAHGARQGGPLCFAVLNGCYTDKLAQAVHDAGVPAVLGWRTKVEDRGARHFLNALFDGCAAGESVTAAFRHACNACEPRFSLTDPDTKNAGTQRRGIGIPLGIPVLITS